VQLAWKLGVVALIALAVVVLPGGGTGLNLAGRLLTIGFFAAIGFLVYRLYRQYRFELDTLAERQRFVLYVSLGVAVLALTATSRLFDAGGAGVLAWFALVAASSYGIFWVWTHYRSYG
jgi:uncharacterized membrane protein YebE (DUF533 family)